MGKRLKREGGELGNLLHHCRSRVEDQALLFRTWHQLCRQEVVNKWTPPRRIPYESTRFSLSMEMSRMTRDGTAEPVSRDQDLRHERGQGNIRFACSADNKQDWQPCPVDPYSCHMCGHSYIHTYRRLRFQVWVDSQNPDRENLAWGYFLRALLFPPMNIFLGRPLLDISLRLSWWETRGKPALSISLYMYILTSLICRHQRCY